MSSSDGKTNVGVTPTATATANTRKNTGAKAADVECSSSSTHHISDVDTWGHPDKNYYIFVALSLFLGLVGADHFYLRSYDTALKKLLVNVGGLGFWYVWDIIQVLTEGKIVRTEGLSSPLDWIRGIGRGVFVPLPIEKKTAADDKKQYAAPKSYVIYTLLAIVLGVFGADKFYLGYTGQGLAKLFSVFNIFLFLFGLLWVLWDAFNAFFRTEALLKEGIVSPLPYSIFFKTPIPAKELFKVQEVKEKNPEEETSQGSGTDWGGLYKQFVVPLLQPSVGKGIQTASQAATVGLKGVAVAKKVGSMDPTSAVGSLSDATGQAAQAQVAQALATPPEQPTVQTIQEIAAAKAAERSGQTGGGGHTVTGGLGPVIAGSLTALVLAGGLKGVYEFLERRHG